MTNEEKILDILAGMQSSMLATRNEMTARFDAVENTVLKTNTKIETDIEQRLDALADGHAAILEQLTPRSRIDSLEQEIGLLKALVYQLNGEVQKLKAL